VTRLRSLLFLIPLLVSEGSDATASEALGSRGIEPEPARVVIVPALLASGALLPAAMGPAEPPEEEAELEPAPEPASLHEVQWTVAQGESRELLASRWGMMERTLVALNPELRGIERVQPGMQLRVFTHDQERPTRSIGAPNKGRLQHGLPMPEGRYWQLRERRTRTYGATNAAAWRSPTARIARGATSTSATCSCPAPRASSGSGRASTTSTWRRTGR
jgi:hypothetical protein